MCFLNISKINNKSADVRLKLKKLLIEGTHIHCCEQFLHVVNHVYQFLVVWIVEEVDDGNPVVQLEAEREYLVVDDGYLTEVATENPQILRKHIVHFYAAVSIETRRDEGAIRVE